MQPSERQLFLKLDDALGELTVDRLKHGDLRHQFRNIGSAWRHALMRRSQRNRMSWDRFLCIPMKPDRNSDL